MQILLCIAVLMQCIEPVQWIALKTSVLSSLCIHFMYVSSFSCNISKLVIQHSWEKVFRILRLTFNKIKDSIKITK